MCRARALVPIVLALAACGPPEGDPAWSFETTRDEPWRPQIHYSPERNWLNDPNGLTWHDGEWHLFYQHQPDLPIWGTMHWGHAVSPDRLHWTELPVAIWPDPDLGQAFSGSALSDPDNRWGLCPDGPCLLAWLTHSGGSDGTQKQSLAVSHDDGRSFEVHPDSPVVANPGLDDFRDPRVFERDGRLHMVVAAGDHAAFYVSDDGRTWTPTGTFASGDAPDATWECPELVFLEDDAGATRAVLAVSFLGEGPQGGSGVGWFLGEFDGQAFTGVWRGWADEGADFYAAQAWSGPDEAPVWTAWASNWDYALGTPTDPWRGAMAFPRRLGLRGSGQEAVLVQAPLAHEGLRGLPEVGLVEVDVDGERWLSDHVPLRVELEGDPGAQSLELSLLGGGLTLTVSEGALTIERSRENLPDAAPTTHHLPMDGTVSLTVLVDRSLVEVFADGGATVLTEQVFADPEATATTLRSSGPVRLERLSVAPLASIWAEDAQGGPGVR